MKKQSVIFIVLMGIALNANASGLFGGGTTANGGGGGGGGAGGKGVGIAGSSSTSGVRVRIKTVLNNEAKSNSKSLSGSLSNSGLNDLTQTGGAQTTNIEGDDFPDIPVSSAIPSNLVATAECMGSSTGAIQGKLIGISGGSTWESKRCQTLADSTHFLAMGNIIAANKRMCFVDEQVDYTNAVSLLSSPTTYTSKLPNDTGVQYVSITIDCWAVKREADKMLADNNYEGGENGITYDSDGDAWKNGKLIQ